MSNTDWMALLDDSLTLDKILIPGTHDSGTEKIHQGGFHTQNFGIDTQLNDGIRFLDIRAANRGGSDPLKIEHWKMDCKITFGKVIHWCHTFLTNHPSEIIIMLMDDAYNGAKCGDGFEKYLEDAEIKKLFYLNPTIPPLRELRGKVFLFRRFERKSRDERGLDLQGKWKDNATFDLTTKDGVKLHIEDEYKQHDTHKKWNSVLNALEAAKKHSADGIFYITYNSIAAGGHTPYEYAWGGKQLIFKVDPIMNVNLKKYLENHSGKQRFGTIMVDYYNNHGEDNKIVEFIINSNY